MKLQNTLADGSGTSCAGGDSISVTSNIVLYAQWTMTTPVNCTLSFMPTRASGAPGIVTNMPSPNPMTVYQGSTFNLLTNVPAMSGYTFLGWNTALNGSGTTYQPGASYTMTADTYLYAQWSSGSLRDGTPDSSPRSGNSICAIETVKYEYGNDTWQDQLTQIKTYSVSAAGVQTLINTQTMAYDTMGNPTAYLGKTLSWEGKQLTGVSATGQSVSYAYDENGLRTQKTVNGTTTNYYYNGSVLIGMVTGSGSSAIAQRFSYDANGKVVSVDYSSDGGSTFATYYYLRNAQNDVISLIDGTGATVVSYVYDSWGKLIATTGTLTTTLGANNPFRYRGYVYDVETGWYYLQSRCYDPSLGRFISSDVLLSTGQGVLGHNAYAYCGNNPVSRIDGSGTSWEEFWEWLSSWLFPSSCGGQADPTAAPTATSTPETIVVSVPDPTPSATPVPTPSPVPNKTVESYIATAESMNGVKKYSDLDCSDFVAEAVYEYDKNFKSAARYQWSGYDTKLWKKTESGDAATFPRGAIIYYATADGAIVHTAIYLGNGMMIDSTFTENIDGVSIRSVYSRLTYNDDKEEITITGYLYPCQ